MIKYAQKVVLQKIYLKNNLFSTLTLKKDIKNLFKLHFEIIEHFIEFIVSCRWSLRNLYVRKMDEKYVLNWLVVQIFQNNFTLKLW